MEKIVYLFGAGATTAEMSRQGIESDVTMSGIAKNVLRLSQVKGGEYWRIHNNFSIPEDQDIETIMSLLEGFADHPSSRFKDVCSELRQLFRAYLTTQITQKAVQARIHGSLLHMHKNYGEKMGNSGEELAGVLTTNYDGLLDEAYSTVYGGIHYGCGFDSVDYPRNESVPPLLKLHGSFNWRIDGDRLTVAKHFENTNHDDNCSGWIPPSVYKRPQTAVFRTVWNKAADKLIAECDVLRVIGSSLRNEDFTLLSLIFTSQLTCQLERNKTFKMELIVPDKDALGEEGQVVGIMQRLPFLGNLRNFSSLPVFEKELYRAENVFYSWVLMKVREIEGKVGGSLEDDFIDKALLQGV